MGCTESQIKALLKKPPQLYTRIRYTDTYTRCYYVVRYQGLTQLSLKKRLYFRPLLGLGGFILR